MGSIRRSTGPLPRGWRYTIGSVTGVVEYVDSRYPLGQQTKAVVHALNHELFLYRTNGTGGPPVSGPFPTLDAALAYWEMTRE